MLVMDTPVKRSKISPQRSTSSNRFYDEKLKSTLNTKSEYKLADTKMYENFNTLNSFLDLPENWNDNDAECFEEGLVKKAMRIIRKLPMQPDVFPTARNSIQFEYEKENGEYLEFEIFSKSIECFMIDADGMEKEFNVYDVVEMIQEVVDFYERTDKRE
ncbi:hypothetical protein ACIQ1H_01100 [Lysinibacillus sp. NPDC097279]|uniref:hypothetical protein n=1 Tax=Lysinibacillus sp. NPDC097279 TaxID=3364143 RepID=UPI003823DBA8